MINVVPHHFLKETIELSEVAEDDVSTEIPGETCRIDDGSRVTTRMLFTLDEDPILVSHALKFARAGQATRPCADDQDTRRVRHLPLPPDATTVRSIASSSGDSMWTDQFDVHSVPAIL
jgi:hypothetical protein